MDKKVEPTTTKTSPQTTLSDFFRHSGSLRPHRDLSQGGFSLVEILVVVAIVGLVSYFALPSLTSQFKISLGSVTRELATVSKEAYNAAVMTGRVYRIAFDLDKEQFWVESGPPSSLLATEASREREERRKRFRKADEEPPPSDFMMDKVITRKKMNLPMGVEFQDVVTEQFQEPIKSGVAYTHFFPHGISEQSLIHLKDQARHQITLQITPILGRTNHIQGYATPESMESAQ